MKRIAIGASVAIALLAGGVLAADLKSGPQPGTNLSPFHPLNINGKKADQKNCLV